MTPRDGIGRREFLLASGAGLSFLHACKSGPIAPVGTLSSQQQGKLADVNTTSLQSAVDLGCQAMGRLFNADDRTLNAPHFGVSVRPDVGMSFHPLLSDAQVPGRHLNALLAAESTLKTPVVESVIDRHARVAFFSYSGAIPLPLNRDAVDGRLVNFAPVNIAHGFHALYALAVHRQSARAQELFEASIASIIELWHPKTSWNQQRLQILGINYRELFPDAPFIAGLGMAIGPLAKYYRVTRSARALELATMLKEKAVTEYFPQNGDYDIARLGSHVHNVVYVMASLAWLAAATRDAELMSRVKAFYDNGLQSLRDVVGWTPEYSGTSGQLDRSRSGDRGEAGNTALIVETALLLGQAGFTDYYADAEVMLRSHLLPSQLRDVSFIRDPSNPNGSDRLTRVAERVQGCWGGPAPYGHQPLGAPIRFGTDTVGTVVAALCEAVRHGSEFDERGHVINLLFDQSTAAVEIESPYTHDALRIRLRRRAAVLLRVPPWVEVGRIDVRGGEASRRVVDGYLRILPSPESETLVVRMPLVRRSVELRSGPTVIRALLRGDEVIGMDSRGTDLRFFDHYAP